MPIRIITNERENLKTENSFYMRKFAQVSTKRYSYNLHQLIAVIFAIKTKVYQDIFWQIIV